MTWWGLMSPQLCVYFLVDKIWTYSSALLLWQIFQQQNTTFCLARNTTYWLGCFRQKNTKNNKVSVIWNLTTPFHLLNIKNNVTTINESKSKMTLIKKFKEQLWKVKHEEEGKKRTCWKFASLIYKMHKFSRKRKENKCK